MNNLSPEVARRRRLVTRMVPLSVVAVVAFVFGAIAGVPGLARARLGGALRRSLGAQGLRRDVPGAEHRARGQVSEAEFVNAYREGAETATLRSISGEDPGDAEERDSSTVVPVPVTARTVAFGTVEDDLVLPYADGGIAWDPSLVFPGLSTGEHLESRVELAPRAPILAADGEALAEGPAEAREHPLGSAMIDVTGEIGMAEEDELPALARHGFPPGTPVGISGVEQAFNARLAGRPGGTLLAVADTGGSARIIARADPGGGRPGEDDDRPGPAGGRRLRARRPRRRGRRPRSPDTATSARSPARPSPPRSRPARHSRC